MADVFVLVNIFWSMMLPLYFILEMFSPLGNGPSGDKKQPY